MTILYIFYIILYIIFNTTGMSHVKKTKDRRPYLLSPLNPDANLSRYYFHNLFPTLCLNQAWMLLDISTTQHKRRLT